MIMLALGCGLLVERFIGLQSILLVFLMAVIGAAIAWGLFPSLFACVLSVVSFNFFLVPPRYTLTIANAQASDIGVYRVTVTNSAGTATSANAVLGIQLPAGRTP